MALQPIVLVVVVLVNTTQHMAQREVLVVLVAVVMAAQMAAVLLELLTQAVAVEVAQERVTLVVLASSLFDTPHNFLIFSRSKSNVTFRKSSRRQSNASHRR